MQDIEQILTHPGGAHKDEFLACCVLLAKAPVTIVRREPTPEDLENLKICVVDVGHEHDPAKLNFDHHQFPRDHVPTCSLSLILQHLELYEEARLFCDWLEIAEWFDCRGPNNTAKKLGVERDILSQLISPIDVTMLRRFAKASQLNPGEPIWELMKMIGEDLLEYIVEMKGRLAYIEENSQTWDIEGHQFIFIPRTDPQVEDASSGLGRYIETKGLQDKVIGMVYPDRRGDGYGLTRYNDSPLLDYTQIDAEPDVHFAHKAGFVAKTSATEESRLKDLIKTALT